MRKLLSSVLLALVLTSCGGSDPEPPAASTPVPVAETEKPRDAHELDLSSYSPGVQEYYGGAHAHGEGEAEYHQPPMPAEAKLGEPIVLTGTEIGVRLRVTPTKVEPVGKDLVAVHLRLKSTGVTQYYRPMEMASVTYPGETKSTPLDPDASARCSNGLDDIVFIEVARSKRGCLLFPRSGDKMPERFQLALEVVPTLAGGIWNLK
jgi:hypothetical protein